MFIPIAENLEIIDALGESVLRQACQALAELRAAGHDVRAIHVNISPFQLETLGFENMIISVLEETGIRPESLWLEITESALVRSGPAVETIQRLRAIGVVICLDDFGSGYASLASLRVLPVDCIKLDRDFLRANAEHETGGALFANLIRMCELLGIRHVVVEGVETPEQATMLAEIGCGYVQGFHFARPAPLEHWLTRPPLAHAVPLSLPSASEL